MTETLKNGLAPIVDEDSTHLILGTSPGNDALKLQRYYAHRSNQFWKILEMVYDEEIPDAYERRIAFLLRHHVALWDVLRRADRQGSLDTFKYEVPNDFTALFERFSRLRAVGLAGTKAAKLFRRYIASQPEVPMAKLRRVVLPSTSSTPGLHVKSLEEKVACWRAFLLDAAPH
ncbi:Uracil-DNA glycosylase superfamily [Burkholderia pseudomallei]|uniref:DNA-deoxyinosine glycosylase n=1 Tax=Burkholderia pseudomallei TaxID=28450 RepID=UPI000F084DD8|nr:DNA-deoxyinosine glycosylase [Burkholderia pseudomallei]CAJ7237612.1 Uracil-DNA glycosylase superfamily [Burkholderia pseudomallei]VBC15455.1 Uracil-DNA glycosylase superfamily [Burkholderia pseudomallei]VBS98759.1 Uracil-DNA glycosylase superfamily [Burkholderia pseudomallei]